MADETPQERLQRFREMAQRMTDALELANRLAVSGDPKQRAIAQQQLPMWADYVSPWESALERLKREIAEGPPD